MITVNGEQTDYEDGMTVASLLKKKKFVFPMLIIRINGRLVEREECDAAVVADNDIVDVIHMMSGG